MAKPTDTRLYEEIKKEVDRSYDKPSAYRSMAYSRFYMRAFREKYGDNKKPYEGKRPGELEKWRRDKWVDVQSYVDVPKDPKPCGTIDYNRKEEYPLCMPLSKVKKYDKDDLVSFINQKSHIGKKRLVKESFLKLINEKPIDSKDANKITNVVPGRKAYYVKEPPVKKQKIEVVKEVKIKEPKEQKEVGERGRPVTVNIKEKRALASKAFAERVSKKEEVIQAKISAKEAKKKEKENAIEQAKQAKIQADATYKANLEIVKQQKQAEKEQAKAEKPVYEKPKRANKVELTLPNYPATYDKSGKFIGFNTGGYD
jgi:hypothetical protein